MKYKLMDGFLENPIFRDLCWTTEAEEQESAYPSSIPRNQIPSLWVE